MSFRTQAVVRQQAAIFDRLGDDATWQGITGTVRVRLREPTKTCAWTMAN
jgi:hypothetical protein